MILHELQKFYIKRIPRSQIKEATYNPRFIEEDARNKLWSNLENRGLLDTLVWNETTGNLVSGHRRLEKLDKFHFKKHNNYDYSIDIAVVNLSLKEEIEQNIFFNNERAQGKFDDDKMLELISNPDLPKFDYDAAGMIDEDISYFGISQNHTNEEVDKIINDFEAIKGQKEQEILPDEYEKRKDNVKSVKKEVTKNETDITVTLTFSSQDAKQDFMKRVGENPHNLFIKGEMFVQKFFSE